MLGNFVALAALRTEHKIDGAKIDEYGDALRWG
jgi:hypothetical protein